MNYIDVIILAILVLSAIMGFWKGFIRQLFGIIALFLGLYCAFHFSGFVASFISKWMDTNETAVNIISFAIIFIGVVVAVVFAGTIAEKLMKVITLGLFNRLIGLLFSVVKSLFILSVFIWLLQALDNLWLFIPQNDCQKSMLFAPIAQLAPAVFPYLKNLLAEICPL